jgi:hypothetical protein
VLDLTGSPDWFSALRQLRFCGQGATTPLLHKRLLHDCPELVVILAGLPIEFDRGPSLRNRPKNDSLNAAQSKV